MTVEDSRNLTTNNAKKIIRLAQCQVEYLLHVQETLVHHKERLRRVAEHAQRDVIEAKAKVRDERKRSKAARADLRTARKALRTYEVLEQIRHGKPLDEILSGAVFSQFAGGGGEGKKEGQARVTRDGVSESEDDAVFPLKSSGAGGDPSDVLAARAAARAIDSMRVQQDVERANASKAAAAESAAAVLRAEKEAEARLRAEMSDALKSANAAAEARAKEQAAVFEAAIRRLEDQLNDAHRATEEARRRAEESGKAASEAAAAARREREEANAKDQAARHAEMNELRASVTNLGLSQTAAVQLAAAQAAAGAAEQRAKDIEARDEDVIADLRERLAARDREVAELSSKHASLESQLITLAHHQPPTPPTATMVHAAASPLPSSARSNVSDVMEDVRSSVVSLPAAAAAVGMDPALMTELEEARAEMRRAELGGAEARARTRAAALEAEVARLRAATAELSAAGDDERARAFATRMAELKERERAAREAAERREKVRAAAAALEATEAKRALEAEEVAAMRRSSPERRAASEAAAAQLRLRQSVDVDAEAGADASPEPTRGATEEGVDDGSGDREAPAAIVLSPRVNEEDLDPDDLMEVSITPGTTPDSERAAVAAKALTAEALAVAVARAEEDEEASANDEARQDFDVAPLAVETAPAGPEATDEAPHAKHRELHAEPTVDDREVDAREAEEVKGEVIVKDADEEDVEEEIDEDVEGEVIVKESEEEEEVPPPPPPRAMPPVPDKLPEIPPAARLSHVMDEPLAMSSEEVDAVIAAEAAAVAAAADGVDTHALRAVIAQADGVHSKQLPPGASSSQREAFIAEQERLEKAAAEAREKLAVAETAAAERAVLAAKIVARAVLAAPKLSPEQRNDWLSKRPFQPIKRAPYALSRFPAHDEELFNASEEAVVGYLEEQMQEQLKEFGIGRARFHPRNDAFARVNASTRRYNPAVWSTDLTLYTDEDVRELDDVRYVELMAAMRKARTAEIAQLDEVNRRRYEEERAAILQHVAAAARAVAMEQKEELLPQDAGLPSASLDSTVAAAAEALGVDPDASMRTSASAVRSSVDVSASATTL